MIAGARKQAKRSPPRSQGLSGRASLPRVHAARAIARGGSIIARELALPRPVGLRGSRTAERRDGVAEKWPTLGEPARAKGDELDAAQLRTDMIATFWWQREARAGRRHRRGPTRVSGRLERRCACFWLNSRSNTMIAAGSRQAKRSPRRVRSRRGCLPD